MSQYRVLIVEDDDLMQRMLQDALDPENFDSVIASDGQEGWNLFQEKDFDLVLLDLKLPKMDGITLLKKIKEVSEDTIVILMTAYGTVETAVEAMKSGAHDFIMKPFLAEELLCLVRKSFAYKDLKQENLLLKKELEERYSLDNLIGKSAAMQRIYRLIETVACSNSTVLIQGASGTGKELVAEAIHHLCPRKNRPLIKVSCAALPESLLESELFGHEKGAFTDAKQKKVGRFELAHMGTLFLDDVDDMSPSVQVKLLRVLQERQFERVGGTVTVDVDVRLVAATKVDLGEAARAGTFREDLYYRLNVVPMILPPLRERKEDIPLLVDHFLKKYNREMENSVTIAPDTLGRLIQYDWPGNIRQLENIVERLVTIAPGKDVLPEYLPDVLLEKKTWAPAALKKVAQEAEKAHIEKTLERTGGRKREAARILEITPKTLWQKIKLYQIE